MKMHERIRNYVDSKGLKLNYVADKSGIERKKFYRLINGDTSMSVDEFEKIIIHGLSLLDENFFEQKFSIYENKNINTA